MTDKREIIKQLVKIRDLSGATLDDDRVLGVSLGHARYAVIGPSLINSILAHLDTEW